MLTPDELLLEDEELIGHYSAQIVRWRDGEWITTLPTLYVILSDRRMILQPEARKRYEPAIIPRRYFTGVEELTMGIRHGVILRLKTGHQIGMFISGDPKRRILNYLQRCFVPPKPIEPKSQVDLEDIRRIIEYFDHL